MLWRKGARRSERPGYRFFDHLRPSIAHVAPFGDAATVNA
jgi:hypothetical protein